jgi:hypothetical protein
MKYLIVLWMVATTIAVLLLAFEVQEQSDHILFLEENAIILAPFECTNNCPEEINI